MKEIWKYTLPRSGLSDLRMPADAKVLSVGMQNDVITIWVLVDPFNERIDRHIVVKGTGHPIDETVENSNFIGTIFDGPFVWHVFDLGEV